MVKSFIWRIQSYLHYRIKAKNCHGIHSPFVYDLLSNTVYNKTPFYIFNPIEVFRTALKNDSAVIDITDHGAGSSYGSGNKRKIATILNQSVKAPKYAQLMFRLAERFKPKTMVELGTSLGITTLYLSYALPESKIITVEGDENISNYAQNIFKKFKRENITAINARFQEAIPKLLKSEASFDFVFFDGHHNKEATLNYFYQFVVKASENSLFIFDDIHWSRGMQDAWEEIKQHDKVSLSLDLFEMGLIFFMPRNQKEHFLIRF